MTNFQHGKMFFHGKETLRIAEQLNGGNFVRIHRCTIVNVNHIRELRHWLRGTYQVFLQDGTQLLLSRSYRDQLFSLLGQPLG